MHEIRQVIGGKRRSKALMAQLLELIPRRYAGVAFELIVPLLSGTGEMERHEPHFVGVTGKLGTKETLTAIEPTQGIFFAIILWEGEFVVAWNTSARSFRWVVGQGCRHVHRGRWQWVGDVHDGGK